jgi:hypothetical protein
MRTIMIGTVALLSSPIALADVIEPGGTLVSGVAVYFDKDSNRHTAPGVQLHCAWGRYGSHEGVIVIECYDIWGADCTSGSAGMPQGTGPVAMRVPLGWACAAGVRP